jgi:regulator of CtrA degradation
MSSSVSSVFENDQNTVSFGQKLAGSEAFKALFKEGMGLVEASAAYLDGAGRAESKALPRGAALAYASESMRLTTRLMQLASWLLLQRAVNEGEMTQAQAASEKKKVKLSRQDYASDEATFAALPSTLQELCRHSVRLQERIIHLDSLLYQTEVREIQVSRPVGLESQLNMLHEAFAAPRA